MGLRIPIPNQCRCFRVCSTRPERILMRPSPAGASQRQCKDLRKHRRYTVADTFLRVIWLDALGDLRIENNAQPINISETGMAVQLPEAARLLSRIRLESVQGELLGYGKVRYSRPTGAK